LVATAAAADDDCAAGDVVAGACALSALQRMARVGKVRLSNGGAPEAEHDAAESAPLPEGSTIPGINLAPDAENITTGIVGARPKTHFSCDFVPYSGEAEGAESCFCHKVRNPTCARKECTCREGCGGFSVTNSESSTFRNRAHTNCNGAYLTIPRSYFTDLHDAKSKCRRGLKNLLEGMLQAGFNAYQQVQQGTVMQCIHLPQYVSVHWLHLHTFCEDGQVDGMPNHNTAICAKMHSREDAGHIAAAMAEYR